MDILLSIKPNWADLILEGKKTVELRKQWTKANDVERIYLYASAPLQKIVGWIELQQAVCEDVADLKRDSEEGSCVSSEDFDAYFKDKEKGWGLFISRAQKMNPLSIKAVDERPPQNWMGLSKEQSEVLRSAG